MKYHLPSLRSLMLSALMMGSALAAPYQVGSMVEGFSAKDQHEKDFVLKPSDTHFLLVSHDMDTGKQANAVLTTLGKDYLTSKRSIYVANIHGMPGIGRMFALPKMKKYAHQIILGDDAELIAKFPAQAGKVTVLGLEAGKVKSVKYWTPVTESLENFLK